jgi:hypothetical protein
MTDSLRILARLLLTGKQVRTLDLENLSQELAQDWQVNFIPGTGVGAVDKQFDDERTLADGVSENLDLSGSLLDAFGASLLFAKIKILAIKNKSATQTLSVGGAATLGFIGWVGDPTDVVKIGPGAMALLICDPAGVAVTAGTGDLLKIANSAGAACIYDIFISGSSA